MTRFVITVRSVSGGAFGGSIGPIKYLMVPNGAQPAPSHAVARTEWIRQVMQTFPTDPRNNTIGNLVFLVHGFNNKFTDAIALHEKVSAGLNGKLSSTIISFDWPSAGEPYAYLPDLDAAKKTAIYLVNAGIVPLILAQTPQCRVAIHVVAHSMGAFVVREALDHADDGILTSTNWTLNQLVLVAGDVEASDFVLGNKNTEGMFSHSYRLTNYFNKFDEVLQISNVKRAGTEPRVGRVGLPSNAPAQAVNIDCSAHFQALKPPAGAGGAPPTWSHNWYFSDPIFFTDLAATLNGAVDRTVVATRVAIPGTQTLLLS